MGRAGQTWSVIGGAVGGLLAGLIGGRLATGGMGDAEMRANVVLGTSIAGAAAGAGIVTYVTAPKQLTA